MEIMDFSDGKSIRWLTLFPEKKGGKGITTFLFSEEIWVKYNFIQIDMGRLRDDCFLRKSPTLLEQFGLQFST